MPHRSLSTLLTGAIDYAGLFPPAELGMSEAVHNYKTYLESGDAWALGRFIVPVSRLSEFDVATGSFFSDPDIWKLSVLAGHDIKMDLEQIADFNARRSSFAVGDTIEAKASGTVEVHNIASVSPKSFHLFIEIPIDKDPADLIRSIGKNGAHAKVRTGGVTGNAFPSARDLERFIRACVTEDVKFKATAGLHHPIRSVYNLTYKPGSERGKMYGYLNVFLAAAFIRTGMNKDNAIMVLEEESVAAFRFGDGGVEWRDVHLDVKQLQSTREYSALSFGSCSFREPLDDLVKLGLL